MPLVSVIWGVALLTLLVTSLISVSTISQGLAINSVKASQMEAAAEAALVHTVVAIEQPQERWIGDGRSQQFDFEGFHMVILLQDESGRIDLNFADGPTLLALFRSVGTEGEAANQIVAAILARRATVDSNNSNLPQNGFQRNKWFETVDELRTISGVSEELLKRVRPALTVYSQRQFVNAEVAPREALMALRNISSSDADHLIDERLQNQAASANDMIPIAGRAFSVRIMADGFKEKREFDAAFRMTDDPQHPYWLLNWREGSTS